MTRATIGHTQTATQQNVHRVATFAPDERSGITCSSRYQAEIEAYEDGKRFKATDITMRTNRAVGF